MFLFILCIPFLAYSQTQENDWIKQHQEEYRNVVKNFYTLLYNEHISNQMLSKVYLDASLDSGMFNKIKPYLGEITFGLSKHQIFIIIDKAEISSEGLLFGVYLELSFSEKKKIYFELSSDIPTMIEYIWLSDGTLLSNKACNEFPVQMLLLVGGVNDINGYADVMETASINSKVVDKFTNNEFFYYVPNSNCDWWQVSRKDDIKEIIGYVNKKQILKYSSMPNEFQTDIRKKRE